MFRCPNVIPSLLLKGTSAFSYDWNSKWNFNDLLLSHVLILFQPLLKWGKEPDLPSEDLHLDNLEFDLECIDAFIVCYNYMKLIEMTIGIFGYKLKCIFSQHNSGDSFFSYVYIAVICYGKLIYLVWDQIIRILT